MSRKMFFAVPLFSLFLFADCAATQAKSDSVAHKSAPEKSASELTNGKFVALLPRDNTSPIAGRAIEFSWTKIAAVTQYRLEIEEAYGGAVIKVALLANVGNHHVPSAQLYSSSDLRWRVVALDQTGNVMAQTPWRTLLAPSSECEN